MSPHEQLLQRIERRQANVAVIGLGYVGLPLVHAFIGGGFRTLGYDVDAAKVDSLNQGKSYIGHIPSTWLRSWLETERFRATNDPELLSSADAVLICVPTPLSAT